MQLKSAVLAVGLLALPAAPLQAATEYTDDIPLSLAKTLLGQSPGQDLHFYRDLPDGFPLSTLPDGMEVALSVDQTYMQRVLVRPRSGIAAGNEALRAALAADGWEAWQPPLQGMMMQQTGFIAGPRLDTPQMFCKDGAGMLQFNAVGAGAETLFQFSYNVLPRGATSPCNPAPNDAVVGARMNPAVLQQQMPRLELPPSLTSDALGMRPGNMMSSGAYFESSASVSTDLSLARLFEHFVTQIEDQGWAPDANTVGTDIANGFWRKQPEDELDLVGVLTVLRSADEQYELVFRVQRLGGEVRPMPSIGIRGMR